MSVGSFGVLGERILGFCTVLFNSNINSKLLHFPIPKVYELIGACPEFSQPVKTSRQPNFPEAFTKPSRYFEIWQLWPEDRNCVAQPTQGAHWPLYRHGALALDYFLGFHQKHAT